MKIPAGKTGGDGIDSWDSPLRRGFAEGAEYHIRNRVEPAAHSNHIAVHNARISRIDNEVRTSLRKLPGISEQCQFSLAVGAELAETPGIRMEISLTKA